MDALIVLLVMCAAAFAIPCKLDPAIRLKEKVERARPTPEQDPGHG